MSRRDVRVRGERRENLDIERFARALIGLAAVHRQLLETNSDKPTIEVVNPTGEINDDDQPAFPPSQPDVGASS